MRIWAPQNVSSFVGGNWKNFKVIVQELREKLN